MNALNNQIQFTQKIKIMKNLLVAFSLFCICSPEYSNATEFKVWQQGMFTTYEAGACLMSTCDDNNPSTIDNCLTNFCSYSQATGLPGRVVHTVYVEPNGTKWFGTDEGLAQFGGNTWRVYNTANSRLPSNIIKRVVRHPNGHLLVGTTEGLAVQTPSGFQVYHTMNSAIPADNINAIKIVSNGDIYLGFEGPVGLAKFDGTNVTVYNTSNSNIPHNSINCIDEDMNGHIWIATGRMVDPQNAGGLAKFDGTTFTTYNKTNSALPDDLVMAVKYDSHRDQIWVGTRLGVTRFDGSNVVTYNTTNSSLPNNRVSDIEFQNNGNLWVATVSASFETTGGIARFDGYNWTNYNETNTNLTSNNINDLTFDINGTLWAALGASPNLNRKIDGGIFQFDGTNFNNFSSTASIPRADKPLGFDNQGNLWIAEYRKSWDLGNYNLVKYDGSTFTVYNSQNSNLPAASISSMGVSQNSGLWFGTIGGGLVSFNGINFTVYNSTNSNIVDDIILDIEFDHLNRIWIGHRYGGLSMFNGSTFSNYNMNNSNIPAPHVQKIRFNSTGIMIAQMGNQYIVKFDGIAFKYDMLGTLNGDPIAAFELDANDQIWVADKGGRLATRVGVQWITYPAPFAGIEDFVYDAAGDLWVIGDQLAKFNGATFSTPINVPEMNYHNIIADGSGTLYMGALPGFVAYNTGVSVCSTPTGLQITDLLPTSLTLNWNTVPGANHYIIEGKNQFSPTWSTIKVPAGQTSYSITGLSSASNYQVRVRSACDRFDTRQSAFSNTLNLHTYCRTPTNLVATLTSTTSAHLTWDYVGGAQIYELVWKKANSFNWQSQTVYYAHSRIVTGLTPGENYIFKVKSVCNPSSNYESSYSAAGTFTTPIVFRLGQDMETANQSFSIFPNPSTGKVSIELGTVTDNFATVEVYDQVGKLYHQSTIQPGQSELKISQLNPGIYFITAKVGDQQFHQRLLVK